LSSLFPSREGRGIKFISVDPKIDLRDVKPCARVVSWLAFWSSARKGGEAGGENKKLWIGEDIVDSLLVGEGC